MSLQIIRTRRAAFSAASVLLSDSITGGQIQPLPFEEHCDAIEDIREATLLLLAGNLDKVPAYKYPKDSAVINAARIFQEAAGLDCPHSIHSTQRIADCLFSVLSAYFSFPDSTTTV